MIFSKDGKRFAYLDKSKRFYVVDGKPDPVFEEAIADFQFSPDGKHYLYGVREAKKSAVRSAIIQNGKIFREINDGTLSITRTPDWKHWAYGGVPTCVEIHVFPSDDGIHRSLLTGGDQLANLLGDVS